MGSSSPKPSLRDALQEGFIADTAPWFAFLRARDLLSHTYDEAQAKAVFEQVKQFPPVCQALIERLRSTDYVDIG